MKKQNEKGFFGGLLSVILGVMIVGAVVVVYVLFDTGKMNKKQVFSEVKKIFVGEKKEHIPPFGKVGEAPKPIFNKIEKQNDSMVGEDVIEK